MNNIIGKIDSLNFKGNITNEEKSNKIKAFQGPQGPQGIPGPQGERGKDGQTPDTSTFITLDDAVHEFDIEGEYNEKQYFSCYGILNLLEIFVYEMEQMQEQLSALEDRISALESKEG